jgi:hypothetical protein
MNLYFSLKQCKIELFNLLKEEKLAGNIKFYIGASLLIYLNKTDLKNSKNKDEICKILELDNISNRHYYIINCSAISGEGIIKIFNKIRIKRRN